VGHPPLSKEISMTQETEALHVGYDKNDFGTMSVPIYQTTAYDFGSADYAADLFALKELGSIYTRLSNPTTDVFEKRISAVEGGEAALATSSGHSAVLFAIINLTSAGDNIIVSNRVYGGTTTLTTHTLKRFGIECRTFDSSSAEGLEDLIDDDTRVIFFESLSNPQVAIPNIEKIVQIANKHDIITVCDNTVATPILFQPLKHGIDVVIHSTSKYINGQGNALGGVLVQRVGLNEKLINNPRYPEFNEPDESYHGLVYAKLDFPIFVLRARLSLMRDFGATPSPFNSWLFIQGLETLHVRMREHSKNAYKVAKYLKNHPKVKSVSYPGLEDDPQHHLVKKYFKDNMSSGLLNFEVEDFEYAKKILNSTKIFSIVTNIGDSKSIITHPASTTHNQVPLEDLKKAGVNPGSIRVSVGLENAEDLIKDLEQALG
jgi:O-acetylhomoserine (thiol)-lyase